MKYEGPVAHNKTLGESISHSHQDVLKPLPGSINGELGGGRERTGDRDSYSMNQ